MVSNDVEALAPGRGVPGAPAHREGTADRAADRPAARAPTTSCSSPSPSLGERVAAELVRFRFAAKCAIEAEEHASTIVLGGPAAGRLDPDAGLRRAGLRADRRRRRARRAARRRTELERLRILARTPAWGRELDDRVLPAEAGLEEHAISFTKGCYPGPGARCPPPLPRPPEPRAAGARARGRRAARLRRRARRLDGKAVGRDHERGRRRRRRARTRLRAPRGPGRRRPLSRLAIGDAATLILPAPVAQGIERCPAEAEVARSNRAGRMRITHGNEGQALLPDPRSRGADQSSTRAWMPSCSCITRMAPHGDW